MSDKPASDIHFVKVGRGRLALTHRPGRATFPALGKMGCTHIVTLLREDEGANKVSSLTREAGLTWVWVPVPSGDYPTGEVHERLAKSIPELSALLDEGKSLLIHCSAGIHRTGTVAYGLLRWRGLNRARALKLIGQIRKDTAEGMGEKRMRWGDELAQMNHKRGIPWISSTAASVNRLLTRISRSR
jgi:protein tyrosine/serine phosphatase